MPLRSRPTASSLPYASSPTATSTWCWIAKKKIYEDSCCHQSRKKDTNISSERHWVNEWLTPNTFGHSSTVSDSKTRESGPLVKRARTGLSPDPSGFIRSQTHELAAPSPSRASDASGNASLCAEWSTNVNPRRRPAEHALVLPSSSTLHGSCSLGSSEPGYKALEVALDLSHIEVARDLSDNARSARYKSVEWLLLVLDAQAEHRVSSSCT